MLLMGWWSRVDLTMPSRVVVAEGGHVLLRVVGRGLGWLRVGDEKRFVAGRFSEVFRVDPSRQTAVTLSGLLGHVRRDVGLRPKHVLHPPAPKLRTLPEARLALERVSPRLSKGAPHVRVPVGRVRVNAPTSPFAS
jgi:hypothetical protein